MATPHISVSPTTIPSGGQAAVSVTFDLNPGTPNMTADLTVYENGVAKGNATGIVLQGTPGETLPNVVLGNSNTGWELRTTAGTLSAGTAQNNFVLRN